MSFHGQIKFEQFFENETVNNPDDEDNQIHPQQRQSPSNIFPDLNLQQNHQQTNRQLCIDNNSNTITCRFTTYFVLFALLVLLTALLLTIIIAFFVKCDESRLTDHYEQQKSSMEKAILNISDINQRKILEMEQNYKSRKIQWIPVRLVNQNLLATSEPAGLEHIGPTVVLIFVARTFYLNGMVVGKYCPICKVMYFGYLGKEFIKSDFEVLLYPPGTLSWMEASVGSIPAEEFLVYGGDAPTSGESTYICRVKHDAVLLVGKYLASSGGCLGAWKNKEYLYEKFEILVVNQLGRTLGVESEQ